jgi:hypothetical protein
MRGPGGDAGMQGHQGRGCDERVSRFAQRRLAHIEQAVKPTDAQRAAFEDFKTASVKAADIVRAACPTERSLTPTGRLEAAEKRVEARLQAIRTVRPALDNFYRSLSDEQKARFNMLRAHHHGPKWAGDWRERWRHEWRRFGRDQDRGGWRDRGGDDRGGWRGRGDGRSGLDERRGGSERGALDGRGGDDRGAADGRAGERDGRSDQSGAQGEDRL